MILNKNSDNVDKYTDLQFNKLKYQKLVIGIDQSYNRCGISIAGDGQLLLVRSTTFPSCKTKVSKRIHLEEIIETILEQNKRKALEKMIIVERIRTFSQGAKQNNDFGLRPDYLKSTGALIGTIVDTAYRYNVPVYSVDTRAWKSAILGSSKGRDDNYEKPEKAAAIKFVEALGFDLTIKDKNGQVKQHTKGKNSGKIYYDDDAADSACIALYGFVANPKLKLED